MCPIKITGMMISETYNERTGKTEYSIRHPKLAAIREEDIDVKDCTLKKILEGRN